MELHDWSTYLLAGRGGPTTGTLEVWAANDRARRFYLDRGWLDSGRERPGPLDRPFVTMVLTPG